MKKFNQLACLICLVLVVSCNTGSKHSNNNQVKGIFIKPEVYIDQPVSVKDSSIFEEEAISTKLFIESEKRHEVIGKLKYDSNTLKKSYNYKMGFDGNEARITLHYISDRIVRIENEYMIRIIIS